MNVHPFNEWSTSVTALAVPIIWQSTLFAGLVAGFCWLLRRSTPVLRYWCWQIIALKLLLMPCWVVAIPLPDFFDSSSMEALPPVAKEAEHGEGMFHAPMDSLIAPRTEEAELPAAESGGWFDFLGDVTWRSWLVLAWLAGIAWQMGYLLAQRCQLMRFLSRAPAAAEPRILAVIDQVTAQLGLSQRPTVVLTEGQGVPFVCGLLRPILVLPRNLMNALDPDQCRDVVLHEMGHVKRRDLWWSWLPTLARIVYFFHPVAHWISFRIRLERELACDQIAMSLSGRSAAEYAVTLVQVVSHASMPAALAINSIEGLNTFWKRRMTMLLSTSQSSPKLSMLTFLAIASTAFLACLMPTFQHAPIQAVGFNTAIAQQEPVTIKAHDTLVCSVAFSPDGKTLASSSLDMTVKVWDSGSQQLRATFKGHKAPVDDVAFSPDGTMLASASRDKKLRIWNLKTGQEQIALKHQNQVYTLAFSPDGMTLASGGGDEPADGVGQIVLWDVRTWKARGELVGHTRWVRSLAFSPNGRLLASSSGDLTVRIWDVATKKEQCKFAFDKGTPFEFYDGIYSVAFSPDGKTLAGGLFHYLIDETAVAKGKKWGEIKFWDVANRQERATIQAHKLHVDSVVFSPDGTKLASGRGGNGDKNVIVWNATTHEEETAFAGQEGGVLRVTFSKDGKRLASVGAGGTIKIWPVSKQASK